MVQVPAMNDVKINPRLAAFTDDLTPAQFQQLLQYLIDCGTILPGNIKFWRINVGLPVDRED